MKPELFSLFDIVIGFGWLIIISFIALLIYFKNQEKPHYRIFLPAFFFQLLFALVFGTSYALVLDGGDTTAYWEGAVSLNQLFWKKPVYYFLEIIHTPSIDNLTQFYDTSTGYPPGWIYREPESFFISKLISPFTFFTFNSYIALTLIFASISGWCSWKFYELVKGFTFCRPWILKVSVLFLPTVAFWCRGLSKDTVVLSAFYILLYFVFSIWYKRKRFSFQNVVMIFIVAFVIFKVRNFMLIATLLPFIFILINSRINKISANVSVSNFIRLGLLLAIFTLSYGYLFYFNEELSTNAFVEEAAIKQQDFKVNPTYTGPKYNLGITDYSIMGMIKAAPLSVITAFYRPFIWEASTAFLLLSSLQGVALMYFTFSFFFRSGRLSQHFSFIFTHDLLIYAIIFSLILGFFAGFTAGLFNVLIRFNAPILPLLFIFFSAKEKNSIQAEKSSSEKITTYP